jgi:hypothetical protein
MGRCIMKNLGNTFLVMVGFLAGIAFVYSCGGGGTSSNADVAALEARIATLEYTLSYAYMSTEIINGVAGPHFIFDGVNVHVQNGSGVVGSINGLGNLIIGYNQCPDDGCGNMVVGRGGSHNLVIGNRHQYSGHTGFVAGHRNTISANHASVSGGGNNTASASRSSVSGGWGNTASGLYASVSGGGRNIASALNASVSGGMSNEATHDPNIYGHTHVSGGQSNIASGEFATVSGGYNNVADQPGQLLP